MRQVTQVRDNLAFQTILGLMGFREATEEATYSRFLEKIVTKNLAKNFA